MLALARPFLWISGAVFIGVMIAVGSLLPGPVVAVIESWDKLEHAGAYAAFTLWLAGMLERRRYLLAGLAAFVLGLSLEILQGALTATRQPDALDLVANTGGILFALALAWLGAGGWAARVERWLGLTPSN